MAKPGGHSFLSVDFLTEVDAIVLTAAAAATIAIWGILSQRKLARQQLTIEHLERGETDKDMIAARQTFIECTKEPGGLATYAGLGFEQNPKTQQIRLILNDFERISIGLQERIIDFDIYHRYARSAVLAFWKHSAVFVYQLRARTNTETLYQQFEELARAMRDDLPPPRPSKNPLRALWRAIFSRTAKR